MTNDQKLNDGTGQPVRCSALLGGTELDLSVTRLRLKVRDLESPLAASDINGVLDALQHLRGWRALLVKECGTDDIAVLCGQRRLVADLRELVWEHHAHGIMNDKLIVCPICTQRKWSDVVDMAHGVVPPNDAS